MNELDTVILTHDIKESNLKKGDVGAIVHVYKDGEAFEIEFTTLKGKTIALLTLKRSDIRKVTKNEVLHARESTSTISV